MKTILFIQNLGMPEIIIIALIILLLFGGKKIPELMRGLGKGVKSFKKGMNEVEDQIADIKEDIEESDSKKPAESKKKDAGK